MATGPYSLTIDGVGGALRVHSLRGKEALSQYWHFDIVTSGPLGDEMERVSLGSRATLILDLNGKRRAFYGVVAAVQLEEVHAIDREVKYSVRLVPRMWLLRRAKRTRIFQNMRVPDIVTAVLGGSGIATRWALIHPYPLREYCTQYEETDYDFVKRLLAESGIYFYFFGGGPLDEGALDASKAMAIGGSVAGAAVDALGGGGAAGPMVDAAVLLGQTLVPGDTVVGADDAIGYPSVAADDPAGLASSTVASMAAGVVGAVGGDSGPEAIAASAAAGIAIAAAMHGHGLVMHYSENAAATVSAYDKIFHFRLRNTLRSHAAQFRDYDPEKPGVRLHSAAVSSAPFPPSPLEIAAAAAAGSQNAASAVAAVAGEASPEVAAMTDAVSELGELAQGLAMPRELYEHHSPFLFPKWAFASEEAPLILRQARRRASIATGEGGNHDFSPGHRFDLHGHSAGQLDAGYVITTVSHRGESDAGNGKARRTYFNTFECAPASMAYPPKRPKRRSVQVSLTATVVGPQNTEIHVDDRGRIKVQFHWDREGKLNGKSSCWIRAMQAWAGPSWGHQFIPRVGMEVVVVFEGGDPDKPMVLGSLYNATHPPSFPLPESKTKSGVRTQSSPGGQGFNELSFEDSAGREEIFLRGQRDLREEILNNRTTSVGADWQETIGNNRATMIGADLEEHVRGDHFIRVDGGHFDDVRGQRTTSVRGIYNVKVREQMSIVIGEKGKPSSGELYTFGDTIVAGTSTVFVRSENLVRLVCGKSYLEVTPDAIRLSADNIILDGKKVTSLKGNGPGMKLGDSAEITGKDIRIVSEKASLILDKEAKLDGTQIKLNCPGMASDPRNLKDRPKTKKVLLQLTDEDSRILAGKEYILMAGGTKTEGTTDGDGNLDVEVPDEAKTADLTVYLDQRPEGRRLQYRIKLEELPPPDTVAGVKARLRNLGYYRGSINEGLDGVAQQAIREFELDYGLEQTGKLGDKLSAKLVEIFQAIGPRAMFKDHAYRTVTATIENQSGETLELEPPGEFEWGQWLNEAPPTQIKSIAPGATAITFTVESERYLTGCEGKLSFKIGKTDNRWEITWNNPFIGWNEYKQYVNGQEYAEVANNDKVDDNLATCTYVCPDPARVKVPPAQQAQGDTQDAVVGPDLRCRVEPQGAEVFVIIMCKQEENPAKPPYSWIYWAMCKWSHKYEDNPPVGEKRIRIAVEPFIGSEDRQADRTKAKERILAAYKEAVDRLNKLGRPGMIIHATGHGAVGNDPSVKRDLSTAYFDLGAQLGGFSTHVLQISNYTFDPPTTTSKDGTVKRYRPETPYWKAQEARYGEDRAFDEYAAEEKDNYQFLKKVAEELHEDRLKVPARVRLLTCSVGSKPDFITRLACEWNIWTEGYTKLVHLDAGRDWHIGFKEGGRWQEDAGHDLPKTNLYPDPRDPILFHGK